MTRVDLDKLLARNPQITLGEVWVAEAIQKKERKIWRLERKEQADFANECLRRKLPFCWHATNARSKATPGTPDFWVGINGKGVWIEFKRDHTCRLSTEQERFFALCKDQAIQCHIVYNAAEAIALVEHLKSHERT